MTDAKSTAEGEGANKDKVAVTASGSAGLGEAIWPALGRLKEPLRAIERTPCAREALLYGIGTGTAVGCLQYLRLKTVRPSTNWAVGAFVSISTLHMLYCRRALAAERERMRLIQEKYAHRHVANLRNPPASTEPTRT